MKFANLKDLYHHELRDLYNAESRLIDTLPQMEAKAHSPELKHALRTHLGETKAHRERLGTILKQHSVTPSGEQCEAMDGLVKETMEILEADGDEATIDAALIAMGNRIEHYEMAGYGAAHAHARLLSRDRDAELLQQTLTEEHAADRTLTLLATSSINREAVHA